jgi:hypothetical protein
MRDLVKSRGQRYPDLLDLDLFLSRHSSPNSNDSLVLNVAPPSIVSGRYASPRLRVFNLIGSRVESTRIGDHLQLKRSSSKIVGQRTGPRETLHSKNGYLWAVAFVEGGSGEEACLGFQRQEVSRELPVIRHPEPVRR